MNKSISPDTTPSSLLLIALLVVGCDGRAAEPGARPEGEAPRTSVTTVVVAPSVEEVTRRFSGYTRPWASHGVGFLVGGRVTSIEVEPGDRVTEGQLLATLAPDDYELVQRLTRVQTSALKPNVERVRRLVTQRVLPASDLDEIEGRYDAALIQRAQAGRQVSYTRLTSPVDGVIHERMTAEGQVVGPGMPVVSILDLARVKVVIGVTQTQLGDFRVGTAHTVVFPGLEGKRRATVFHVGYVADPRTRTFAVELEVDNGDGALRPSMLAQVQVVTDRHEGLFVPLYAVVVSAEGQRVVRVVGADGQTVVERSVRIGPVVGERVQVLEGLEPGARVIVAGQEYVGAGDRVRLP